MSNIFSDLDKFGLANIESPELFKQEQNKEGINKNLRAEKVLKTADFIYQKKFICPICDTYFNASTIRRSKLALQSIETDLRPVYKAVEPLCYDVIMCENCGHAALHQKFNHISDRQVDMIKDKICAKYKPFSYPAELTLEMGVERLKLALLNCAVRNGDYSEKAYICMKLSWLFQILDQKENEMLFVQYAYNGFSKAYTAERSPFMGLSDSTVLFLLGVFANKLHRYDDALKYIANILTSSKCEGNLKNRARDLKDDILESKRKLIEQAL